MRFSHLNFRASTRTLLPATLIVLFSVIAAEASYRSGWVNLVEHAYSDLWHRLSGVRHTPQHVVLVVMDDQSLALHPDDPLVFWTPHIAQAIAVLREAGAVIVGLDFLYAISPEAWLQKMRVSTDISRTYDLPFRNQISSGQLVMVGSQLNGTEYDDFLLPHPDYLLPIPDANLTSSIGLANLSADNDGNVRSFVTAPRLREAPQMAGQALPRLTLGTLLAVRARGLEPMAPAWQLGGRTIQRDDQLLSIGYAGPPGTMPRIPLSRLLATDAGQDPLVRAVQGKVVIIGGEFLGMNDWHATPYSSGLFGAGGNLMTGPELQANVVETLLSGKVNQPLSTPARLAYFLLAIGLAVLVYRRRTPWQGLLMFGAISGLAAAFAYYMFNQYVLAPAAHLQVGLLAGYLGTYGKRLTAEERMRARVTQIFGRYVSSEVVEMLLRSKKMPDLGGE